jgi:hypothetical protein
VGPLRHSISLDPADFPPLSPPCRGASTELNVDAYRPPTRNTDEIPERKAEILEKGITQLEVI